MNPSSGFLTQSDSPTNDPGKLSPIGVRCTEPWHSLDYPGWCLLPSLFFLSRESPQACGRNVRDFLPSWVTFVFFFAPESEKLPVDLRGH